MTRNCHYATHDLFILLVLLIAIVAFILHKCGRLKFRDSDALYVSRFILLALPKQQSFCLAVTNSMKVISAVIQLNIVIFPFAILYVDFRP